ncbi:hypothetical protein JCM5350_003210 [Sporobolomyces pararoseus]
MQVLSSLCRKGSRTRTDLGLFEIQDALGYSVPSSVHTGIRSSTNKTNSTTGIAWKTEETRIGTASGKAEEDEREGAIRRALEEAMRDYVSDSDGEGDQIEGSYGSEEAEQEEGEEPLVLESENDETKESIQPTSSPDPFTSPFAATPNSDDQESRLGTSPSLHSVPPVEVVKIPIPLPPTTHFDSLTSSQSIPESEDENDHLRNEDLRRRSYDLSTTLLRFSRRATVCLTTLNSFEPSPSILPAANPYSHEESIEQVDLAGNEEVVSREKELELIETILGEELQAVQVEVEEFVERIIAEEQETAPATQVMKPQLEFRAEAEEEEEQGWSWFRDQAHYKDFNQVRWSEREGTNAEDFCQACEGLIRLAEHLAPALAGLATKDIGIELKKIRSRTTMEKVSTLEQIIILERNQRRKIATGAINWLLLILKFGTKAYQTNLASIEKEELSVSFSRVWDQEYYKYFNFIVRPLFKVSFSSLSSRFTEESGSLARTDASSDENNHHILLYSTNGDKSTDPR